MAEAAPGCIRLWRCTDASARVQATRNAPHRRAGPCSARQIQIDGPFGVNRDELLHLPSGQKWNGCQPGADRADGDHRSQFHFERDIYSIGFGVVLWWIFVNASSQPVLLAQ